MKKITIYDVLSFVGLLLTGAGTLMSHYSDDKKLDMAIDEKISNKLSAYEENEDESEES